MKNLYNKKFVLLIIVFFQFSFRKLQTIMGKTNILKFFEILILTYLKQKTADNA